MRWVALYQRRELTRWWRGLLLASLLIGLLGGVVLAAAAGARRTQSAFPRLFDETDAADVLVNPDEGSTDFEALAELPGIERWALLSGAAVVEHDAEGDPDFGLESALFFLSEEGAGLEFGRPLVTKGRLPRADAPHEVFANDLAAEAGHRVGDTVAAQVYSLDDLMAADEGADPTELGQRVEFTVVGEGRVPDQIVTDDTDRLGPVLFLSPSFAEEYDVAPFFTAFAVDLERGTDGIADFVQRAQAISEDELVFYQTKTGLLDKAARSVRPFVGALAIFAAVTAAAGALIMGQAVVRQVLTQSSDYSSLRALGAGPRQFVAMTALQWLAVGIVGAAIAGTTALLLSPLAPIGPARQADAASGLHVDGLVFALGLPSIVAFPVLVAAVPAWLTTRAAARRARAHTTRTSVIAESLARGGFPSPVVSGVRLAVEPGSGSGSVPVRTTIVGVALSIVALCAALTFGSSLDRLLTTPRLYGANWDLELGVDNDTAGPAIAGRVERHLVDDNRIAAASAVGQGQLVVDGVPVPAIGVDALDGGVPWTIRHGQFLNGDDTIVLGTNVMRKIGASVGDTVTVSAGGREMPMRVAGQAVFGRFAAYPGADKIGLGDGAMTTLERLLEFSPTSYVNQYLIDVGDGASVDAVAADLEAFVAENLEGVEDVEAAVTSPPKPDDIRGYEDVDNIPLLLAGFLLVVAGIATAHALVLSVRRRRRELALLKTIGFSRRQVSITVAVQATTIALVAIVVGVPLGLAAGRAVWSLLADRIGALSEPSTPWFALLVVIPATIVAVNLVAAVPARRAGGTHPAAVLRAE